MTDPRPGSVDGTTCARLAAWLSECLGEPVRPDALRIDTPSGGGWSNETWIVDTGGAERRRVVVRVQPARASMFPHYDLGRQLLCLQALGPEPAVPTPAVLGADPTGQWLGRPAFVMDHVDGRSPSDDSPSFAEAGWLADAQPADQRRFHVALLDAIAAVHAVDLDRRGLGVLRNTPEGPHQRAASNAATHARRDGSTSNTAALAELRSLWHWDRGPRWPATVDTAFDLAARDVPDPSSECLLWGDARPANVVVAADGFEPIALLDWELAAVGSPEHDVTWLMEMNWVRMQGAGLEPLPGFLTDEETVIHYETRAGHRLADLVWYRYVAALRVAVLMHRYLRAMVHSGRLAADHRVLGDTVASRRLASLVPP